MCAISNKATKHKRRSHGILTTATVINAFPYYVHCEKKKIDSTGWNNVI
jgi:hypothetical protein